MERKVGFTSCRLPDEIPGMGFVNVPESAEGIEAIKAEGQTISFNVWPDEIGQRDHVRIYHVVPLHAPNMPHITPAGTVQIEGRKCKVFVELPHYRV